mmetsp:Transcript_13453/g.25255  ORF Transcript_13453/g.25255 Transcript_13453/m.25255 type:complete len:106 (+) Transcript_13453:662-979(+)
MKSLGIVAFTEKITGLTATNVNSDNSAPKVEKVKVSDGELKKYLLKLCKLLKLESGKYSFKIYINMQILDRFNLQITRKGIYSIFSPVNMLLVMLVKAFLFCVSY